VPIGAWVLRQACAEASLWADPVRIAVNLSPVQYRNPYAEIPQGMQRRDVGLARGQQHRFGDLQFEPPRKRA
jgi:EAL domain-containing protein (putative c-di-GMP-specific phosphodiesterase class I)